MDKNAIFEQFSFRHYNNKQQVSQNLIVRMKILKRLSLMSTIDQRIMAPKPHSTWLQRIMHSSYKSTNITPQQQLIKYGFTSKPILSSTKFIIMLLSAFTGLFIHLYLTSIYKNEQIVRQKYRIEQQQHSSIQLRVRRFIFNVGYWMEKNIFFAQILFNNQTKKLVLMSQAILRTQQYRRYMREKDRKFQMMDLGVMEKYPFPDMKDGQ